MFGERLGLARKRAGLSTRALAERVTPKISAYAIGRHEKSGNLPTGEVFASLCKVLDVSAEYLIGTQVKELRGVEWRKKYSTRVRERAEARVFLIERLERYITIEQILELPSVDDPFATLRVDHLADDEAIEKKAREVRGAWNLGNDPIPSMTALLEDQGMKVIEGDLPDRINGFTRQAETSDGALLEVILVSRRTGVERKRFSLAHDLAHRVIAATGNPELKKEKAVDRFAGAFLIPRGHLEDEVRGSRRGMGRAEIMRLKRVYGVPAAAMLMRLHKVDILSESELRSAFKTYARDWRTKEPDPIDDREGFAASETPQRFERLVWRALTEKEIHTVRASEMLRMPLSVVEHQFRRGNEPESASSLSVPYFA